MKRILVICLLLAGCSQEVTVQDTPKVAMFPKGYKQMSRSPDSPTIFTAYMRNDSIHLKFKK